MTTNDREREEYQFYEGLYTCVMIIFIKKWPEFKSLIKPFTLIPVGNT